LATQFFVPAMVLVIWSIIMLIWTGATRFPAIAKTGVDVKNVPPGGRGQNLDGVLPDNVQWKSHNYAHLMEQPTIFYPTILVLALLGQGSDLNLALAWGYVALRIVHSIWQATVNTIIPVRFGLFVLSTICLAILAVHALMAAMASTTGGI
jgi:hypothetical protein